MKGITQNPHSIKKISLSVILIMLSATYAFAQNAFDSDLSNSADSNAGKDQTGMYIFIVLLLVLSVVVAFWESKKKEKL